MVKALCVNTKVGTSPRAGGEKRWDEIRGAGCRYFIEVLTLPQPLSERKCICKEGSWTFFVVWENHIGKILGVVT